MYPEESVPKAKAALPELENFLEVWCFILKKKSCKFYNL